MAKSLQTFGSLAVAAALLVPATAWGQAGPRTSGTAGTAGSSSSGGSSGGGGSSSSSGGNSGGGASEGTRVSPPSGANGGAMFPSEPGREPSRIPRSTSTSSPSRVSGSGIEARVAPPPGAVAPVNPTSMIIGTAGSRFDGVSVASSSVSARTPVGGGASTGARSRDDGGVRGVAGARPLPTVIGGDFVSLPFYGPWGGWYPWCSTGFGWGLGFVYYDPWFYGPTSWYWGRYGMWYDPYAYFWDPYVSVGYSGGGGGGSSSDSSDKATNGSLRIKANVSQAMVFVDGALAGKVDEFDGLKNHLDVDAGRHSIELRAEGYETVSQDVVVAVGKTKTLRLEMKKVSKEIK